MIVTAGASRGLDRCRRLLAGVDRQAAARAAAAIGRQFALLKANPEIGRPLDDLHGLRELIIRFGDPGYLALYRHEPAHDAIYVLAFRHQKEAGY